MDYSKAIEQKTKELNELIKLSQLKPVKVDFKAEARKKGDRLDKIAAAFKKGKEKDTHQALTAAGWLRGVSNEKEGTAQYGHKSKPGYLLKIHGNTFSVHNGIDVKIPPTNLSFIQVYLNKK